MYGIALHCNRDPILSQQGLAAIRRARRRFQAQRSNPDRIRRILLALDAAKSPDHMNVPGFRFHPLKGHDRGRYAVDASGNWRVTFAWDGEDAIDIDLEDYH